VTASRTLAGVIRLGGPPLVGWAPRGRPPRLAEGVGCLGTGRLGVGGVLVGDERAGCEAGGPPRHDPVLEDVPPPDPRGLLVLRRRLGDGRQEWASWQSLATPRRCRTPLLQARTDEPGTLITPGRAREPRAPACWCALSTPWRPSRLLVRWSCTCVPLCSGRTPGLRRRHEPERRRSGGASPSPACPGSARAR